MSPDKNVAYCWVLSRLTGNHKRLCWVLGSHSCVLSGTCPCGDCGHDASGHPPDNLYAPGMSSSLPARFNHPASMSREYSEDDFWPGYMSDSCGSPSTMRAMKKLAESRAALQASYERELGSSKSHTHTHLPRVLELWSPSIILLRESYWLTDIFPFPSERGHRYSNLVPPKNNSWRDDHLDSFPRRPSSSKGLGGFDLIF